MVRRQLNLIGTLGISHAVEMGCGTGEVAAFLAHECGIATIGVDVDLAQVQLARSRHGEHDRLRFVVADACRTSLDAHRYDLVVAYNVFHHIPDWPHALREIGRILRPGGIVLWLDLAVPAFMASLLRPFRGWGGVFTISDVRTAFRDAGFIEVAAGRDRRHPLHHELVLRKHDA